MMNIVPRGFQARVSRLTWRIFWIAMGVLCLTAALPMAIDCIRNESLTLWQFLSFSGVTACAFRIILTGKKEN